MDFYRKDDIDGFTSYNLINITDKNPCGMSCFWFIFFTLIGIVQIYKSYIDSRCTHKSFTIKKIISTRYNLSTVECDIKYKNCDPVISYDKEVIQIPSDEFRFTYNSFKLDLPTQEEIDLAKQHSNNVFKIDTCDGNKFNMETKTIGNENNINDIDTDSNGNLEEGLLPKYIN